MQSFQFQTVLDGNNIRIPDEYKNKIGTRVIVTIVNENTLNWDEIFPPCVDTTTWKFNREEANAR